jgi:hypothetical protein
VPAEVQIFELVFPLAVAVFQWFERRRPIGQTPAATLLS